MYLTRHLSPTEPLPTARWAVDGYMLPAAFDLGLLLQLDRSAIGGFLQSIRTTETVDGKLLAPLEPTHEVWACGVTYSRSREAREEESTVKDVYARVYEAKRPELFWKSIGWRVSGHHLPIRIRDDSAWNVPEPELTLVINAHGQIVGHCVGNDVSSRDIEGENPLYLPQAKVYDGSCALGPGIWLGEVDRLRDLPVQILVTREGRTVFEGETRTSRMKRPLEELAEYLGKELHFPRGAFLMTGTGIVPAQGFSLQRADTVRITIGDMTLQNQVAPAVAAVHRPRAWRG